MTIKKKLLGLTVIAMAFSVGAGFAAHYYHSLMLAIFCGYTLHEAKECLIACINA
jgi:hypothetical protein